MCKNCIFSISQTRNAGGANPSPAIYSDLIKISVLSLCHVVRRKIFADEENPIKQTEGVFSYVEVLYRVFLKYYGDFSRT